MRFAPTRSAAAPGTSQDARTRPVTNHTAPVTTGSCAAVEPVELASEPARPGAPVRRTGRGHPTPDDTGAAPPARRAPHLTLITGGPASDAGIAGMAGPAGAGRPGTFEVPSL